MQATIQASREDYRASDYNKTASFVYSEEFTSPILRCLNPSEGDRIIDLGCGSGELTVKIQDAVGTKGFVVGVDCNEDMVCRSYLQMLIIGVTRPLVDKSVRKWGEEPGAV